MAWRYNYLRRPSPAVRDADLRMAFERFRTWRIAAKTGVKPVADAGLETFVATANRLHEAYVKRQRRSGR